eukprot:11233258-Alexandrium_andersonii.AAC.1
MRQRQREAWWAALSRAGCGYIGGQGGGKGTRFLGDEEPLGVGDVGMVPGAGGGGAPPGGPSGSPGPDQGTGPGPFPGQGQ